MVQIVEASKQSRRGFALESKFVFGFYLIYKRVIHTSHFFLRVFEYYGGKRKKNRCVSVAVASSSKLFG